MIAALPMYDWPALRPATDAFWASVAERLGAEGIEAPAALTRPRDPGAAWRDPDLVIGQTCGMPYVCGHCGAAQVIARPDYGLRDAAGGLYRSVIVGRVGERAGDEPEVLLAWQGGRVALNEWASFSGHIALRAHLAELRAGATGPFFGAAVLSGSHRASARLVARGAADVAALDAVAWALLEAHEPETAGRLAVLGRTTPAPALPYITAPRFAGLGARLARALDAAAAALAPVPGLPRRVAAAGDADYASVRAAARLADREPLAPDAPAVSSLCVSSL